ncbi:MAG: hypothetical protein RL609_228 [Bacteroidota bacterium]|jgi:TfoX/Sxy family transcriptional regulator of competence genes
MGYSEDLANKIRTRFENLSGVAEKEMMGGWVVMLNDKMCVGIIGEEMMCRIDPSLYEASLEKRGCHEMLFAKRAMKGYVMIDPLELERPADLNEWIDLAIAFNPKAKSSKKKKA